MIDEFDEQIAIRLWNNKVINNKPTHTEDIVLQFDTKIFLRQYLGLHEQFMNKFKEKDYNCINDADEINLKINFDYENVMKILPFIIDCLDEKEIYDIRKDQLEKIFNIFKERLYMTEEFFDLVITKNRFAYLCLFEDFINTAEHDEITDIVKVLEKKFFRGNNNGKN